MVDDKSNGGGLTNQKEYEAIPKNLGSSAFQAALNYSFSYGVSSLLSSHPVGAFVDFTVGAIIVAKGGFNTNLISSTSDSLYRLFISSVSQLQYYWLYNGSSWQFIGSEGHFSYKQEDFMKFNSQGAIKTVINDIPVKSSTSGHWSAYQHVSAYHNSNKSLSYSKSYPFGTIPIYGYNNFNITFVPVYYTLPG